MIKKKQKNAVIAGVLAVALISGGIVYARSSISKKEVAVYPASLVGYYSWENGQSLEGQVTDSAVQDVKRANGLIDSVKVKVGSKVKKGDLLLKYNVESVKLAVEADQASIALLEAEIASADAEISRLQSLHPSEEMPEASEQVIHHIADPVSTLSVIDVGTSASAEGNVYFCTADTRITAAMLQYLDDNDLSAEFKIYENNVEMGSWKVNGATINSGTKIITIIKEKEEEPSQPETPDQPDDPSGSGTPDQSENAGQQEKETASPSQASLTRVLIKATALTESTATGESRTEEWAPYEDWTLGDGVVFAGDGTASVDYSVKHYGEFLSVIPEEAEWDEVVIIDPQVDTSNGDYCFSREDLAGQIKDKQSEIKDKELSLKEAKLKLEEDKLVSTDGKVLSAMDGVVTEVKDPSEVKAGETLIKVKGETGFTITVNVSEYLIKEIQLGETLQVTTFESASSFTAEVTDISFEPIEHRNDNKNMTFYPVTATAVDQDIDLKQGESCQIERAAADATSDVLCISNMFVRKDDQGSYCMIADEEDRLKKVYVQTGSNSWGAVEILSGITSDDRIAFPYGKNVQEGSPVVEKETFEE